MLFYPLELEMISVQLSYDDAIRDVEMRRYEYLQELQWKRLDMEEALANEKYEIVQDFMDKVNRINQLQGLEEV